MTVPRLQRRLTPSLASMAFALVVLSSLAPWATTASAQTAPIGPDVIVSGLGDFETWGATFNTGAYSFATTSCNIGDQEAAWFEFSNQHPVIAQNVYRYENGRFEQIGMSWLKHGFCALDQNDCGTCVSNGNCDLLGVGCADTYGAVINGTQGGLGARSDVNPSTGAFTYPYTSLGTTGPVTFKRIQLSNFDLSPSLNPGARFFYEGQYVHFEEPAFGTQYNSVSHREFNVGSFSNGYSLNPTGPTYQQEPAIAAWQLIDPDVELVDVFVPMDGLFVAGGRATDNGNGTWRYEYAVYNMNSDRAAGSFEVPFPPGSQITNADFTDINYHSLEVYSSVDWSIEVLTDRVRWSTEDFATNANANALRWGTLYRFGFDADVAPDPATSTATLGLFKPGPDAQQTFSIVGPGGCTPFIRGDVNGDGAFSLPDVIDLLAFLFANGSAPQPVVDAGDVNSDGSLGLPDAITLLAFLFANGPNPAPPFPDPGCS